MIQNFNKFGKNQWCCIDFTWNMIKDKIDKNKHFRLGCFMGISNTFKMIPFCLVVTAI